MCNLFRRLGRNFIFVSMLVLCLFGGTGCKLYDQLVSWIQTSFSGDEKYEVSVINCKHFKAPEEILAIIPQFSRKLTDSMKEGVVEVSQLPKFSHIKLVQKIPTEQFPTFHDFYFSDDKTYEQRTEELRKYCSKYKTNIIIWGATMGDDSGMVFMGWMYRRDQDVVVKTRPVGFTKDMSPRVQEEKVKDAVADIIKSSLQERPIGKDGKLAADMYDNKKAVLATTGVVLSSALKVFLQRLQNGAED
jgi:hypothetical protein